MEEGTHYTTEDEKSSLAQKKTRLYIWHAGGRRVESQKERGGGREKNRKGINECQGRLPRELGKWEKWCTR